MFHGPIGLCVFVCAFVATLSGNESYLMVEYTCPNDDGWLLSANIQGEDISQSSDDFECVPSSIWSGR